MPETARQTEPEHEHEAQHTGGELGARPTPGRRDTHSKAGAAAIKRMLIPETNVGGPEGATSAPLPSVGESGMITAEVKLAVDGKDTTVPPGTVAHVTKVAGQSVVVKLWSGFGGAEATVDAAAFKAEPTLTFKDEPGKKDQPQDYTYQEYASVLWDGAPKAGDVAQGAIGDCYLIAGMGAVAAGNPGQIQKLFSPQTPCEKSYTVTLYVRDTGWKLSPKGFTVDTYLPTKLADVTRNAPAYAMNGTSFKDQKKPIWPALLEKAYAQAIGGKEGYKAIGGGGSPGKAMESLTGVESEPDTIPKKEEDILKQFREYQKAGKGVVCGTHGSRQASKQGGFSGSGDGPYCASFRTDQGMSAKIVDNTLRINDKAGKAGAARDDGNGKITGTNVAEGSVAYKSGSVDVKYKESKGPAKAEDLEAEYSWRGVLDKDINIYTWHAYIFEKVTDDGKLVFKNPWGDTHPNPIDPKDFSRIFDSIDTNDMRKDNG